MNKPNKLRIAILSPIHWRTPPHKYGPWEQVASNITEELVRRGHTVTLYATADSVTSARLRSVVPRGILEEGEQTVNADLYGRLHAVMPFEDAAQFDIIHNHYDGYPLILSRLVDVPVVSTVHGFSSPYIHELYERYDNVHYVSISLADRAQCPQMHWVDNIHHGMDMTQWAFNANPEYWLGFIGRIHPSKGAHIAIEVARRAGRVLKIAGAVDRNDSVVAAYWAKEIEPHVDGRQVVYAGELGGRDKVEFYRQAAAILAPVLWDEPFGLVLIEAMAAGTPVVAYGRGSVPEVVREGVGGLVVPPGDVDGMVAAVGRIGEVDRAGVRVYAEENFSVAKMVDQYEALYRRILEATEGGPRAA